MATPAFGRIKFFRKSGARLYIPQKVIGNPRFPFKDCEVVKIDVGNDSLGLRRAEWWEMLDWSTMPDAYEKLPEDIKQKVKASESL